MRGLVGQGGGLGGAMGGSRLCPPPPQLTEKLLDMENESVMRVAELEKQLLQREKELQLVKVGGKWGWGRREGSQTPPQTPHG